jgi:hypothetical protein
MPGKIDPAPAIKALIQRKWRLLRSLNEVRHNGYLFLDSAERERRLQFQGRNHCNRNGQFLFGMYYRDFEKLDDVVLWTEIENAMLVLPAQFLQSTFSEQINRKIDKSNRWHVSVYFNRNAESVFHPTHGTRHIVSQYKLPLSAPALSKSGQPENRTAVEVPETSISAEPPNERSTANAFGYEKLVESAAAYGGGGETNLHKDLKRYVAENPTVVGLPLHTTPGQQEYALPSGDSVDVFFSHAANRLAVEVKSRISPKADIVRGLFQCIKYRAVLCACIAADGSDETADALLVLEGALPGELNALRQRLNVRVIDNIRIPIS